MFPDTIVVPLDRSEFAARALPVARAFVRQTSGRLRLMSTRWDDDVRTARQYLDVIAAVHQDVDVSTVVIADRPAADAIQLVATEGMCNLNTRTGSPRGRALTPQLLAAVGESRSVGA